MIVNEIEFSEIGEKTLIITYKGKEFYLYVTIYDLEITNIRYIDAYEVIISQGEDLETALLDQIGTFRVEFIIPINGLWEDWIEVTLDMIDGWSDIDTNIPGIYTITLNYEGYTKTIIVFVLVNMNDAEIVCTLYGDIVTLAFDVSFDEIRLYDNDFAAIYCNDINLSEEFFYFEYEYIDDNTTLILKISGENTVILSADLQNNKFAEYDFGEMVETEYALYQDEDDIIYIYTYENGFAKAIMGEGEEVMTLHFAYCIEEDIFTILPSFLGIYFTIGENNILTMDWN